MIKDQPHGTRVSPAVRWKGVPILLLFALTSCTGPAHLTVTPNDYLGRVGSQGLEEDIFRCRQDATTAVEEDKPNWRNYIVSVPLFTLVSTTIIEYGPFKAGRPLFGGVVITSGAIASGAAAIVGSLFYWRSSMRYWHLYDEHVARCLMDQGYEVAY